MEEGERETQPVGSAESGGQSQLDQEAVVPYKAHQIAEVCQWMQELFQEKNIEPRLVIYACDCFVANICKASNLSHEDYMKLCIDSANAYKFLWDKQE